MGQRRKAREIAVQTIYALDFTETDPEFREFGLLNNYPEILNQIAEHEGVSSDNASLLFAEDLIRDTIIHLNDIDSMIAKHSVNWSLERIANLDHCILRIAVYEMMFTSTPAAIVINEAIEIAKKYSSESSNKFINGILDAVNKELSFKSES